MQAVLLVLLASGLALQPGETSASHRAGPGAQGWGGGDGGRSEGHPEREAGPEGQKEEEGGGGRAVRWQEGKGSRGSHLARVPVLSTESTRPPGERSPEAEAGQAAEASPPAEGEGRAGLLGQHADGQTEAQPACGVHGGHRDTKLQVKEVGNRGGAPGPAPQAQSCVGSLGA